ncbi:hypothetical protein BO83DRAFT_82261 [Aspergillus eucalypticola CBS 122712]|uniref:Uncharacterized protein n=1 Tax=Aspergillus eucalypticola (strain CBS 122712 / IBT 29274) TaxID=1448314 RepID=A0A317WEK6_ASPEC|nr:uncharacterized protein BO83DRAFT_82261 [Aspergillus eucalypticola CBS 122712]PWY84171.1 hypothetical protein BO83DRAFT_82261 [Aspergillus eucalypticola CBS 122712]
MYFYFILLFYFLLFLSGFISILLIYYIICRHSCHSSYFYGLFYMNFNLIPHWVNSEGQHERDDDDDAGTISDGPSAKIIVSRCECFSYIKNHWPYGIARATTARHRVCLFAAPQPSGNKLPCWARRFLSLPPLSIAWGPLSFFLSFFFRCAYPPTGC